MIITEEAYFRHSGVKGMRWGVRKDRSSGSSPSKSGGPSDAKIEQRKERAKKVAIGLGVAGIGVATAAMLVRQNKGKKLAEVQMLHKNVLQAQRLFDAKKGLQIDELNRQFNAGRVTREQAWRVSSVLDKNATTKVRKSATSTASPAVQAFIARQRELNKLANSDLKAGYEANQTPLNLRQYLSDW